MSSMRRIQPIGGKPKATRGEKRPSTLTRDALRALAVGIAGSVAAWLVGIKLLGKPYYFAWAIVAAMGIFLLLAWLLYLRDDAFMSRPASRANDRSGSPPPAKPPRRSVRVLLMAATMLAALSVFLYFCLGIGASP